MVGADDRGFYGLGERAFNALRSMLFGLPWYVNGHV